MYICTYSIDARDCGRFDPVEEFPYLFGSLTFIIMCCQQSKIIYHSFIYVFCLSFGEKSGMRNV